MLWLGCGLFLEKDLVGVGVVVSYRRKIVLMLLLGCVILRDAYFTLFVDIHPGKVFAFYSVYLTNWEKLPFFGHFYPGRVYHILENIHPWRGGLRQSWKISTFFFEPFP